jgi:DNA-binding NtrC family response regulator
MSRILIIDDEQPVRSVFRRALERAGHEVSEAGDGQAGLKQIAQSSFDLVVTDIVMPEMEGIEFILQLHREQPDLKVIAMSGGGRVAPKAYLDMARAAGAVSVLAKPFTIEALLAAVDAALKG